MYVCEKGLAFLISHLTRQRHFSGPLFIVRGHAMTWVGYGRDLGLSEVTAFGGTFDSLGCSKCLATPC